MSANMRAAFLMMASMASFTINDAFIKLAGDAVPLMQILFLRGILASLLVFVLARQLNALRFDLTGRDWGLIGVRTAAEVGAAWFFLTALLNMPLANVSAILQVLPLTVALGAALVFGETLGWRRILAIFIGFCGVLLIVRPGMDGFSLWSVYVLVSVLCITVRDLTTRSLSPEVPSLTVTLAAAVGVLVFSGLVTLGQPWVPVRMPVGMLILGSGVFIVGGYYFSVQVMREGDIGFVAPFRYTSLIWALALGLVLFGEWPDALTLVGAGLVVGTGVFTLYRQHRASKI